MRYYTTIGLRTGQKSTDRTFFSLSIFSSVFDDGLLPCMGKSIVLKSLFCNYNNFLKICFDIEKKVSTDRTLFA